MTYFIIFPPMKSQCLMPHRHRSSRSQQDILQKQEVLEAYSVRGHELFTDVWEGFPIAAYLFLTQKRSAFCSLKILDLSLFMFIPIVYYKMT